VRDGSSRPAPGGTLPALGSVQHLRAADVRRVPWKNGRGFTDELALWPPAASFEKGDFDWRISKAAVEEDGPFSNFPGFERVLVVTTGAGLVLDHGAHAPRRKLEILVPYRFSGDWPTRAELLNGRVDDFNVLCRRGSASAEVEAWNGRVERDVHVAEHEQLFLHVLVGDLEARSPDRTQPWKLASGESLALRLGTHPPITVRVAGTALAVRIRPWLPRPPGPA
jgi:uncharacterized protein